MTTKDLSTLQTRQLLFLTQNKVPGSSKIRNNNWSGIATSPLDPNTKTAMQQNTTKPLHDNYILFISLLAYRVQQRVLGMMKC